MNKLNYLIDMDGTLYHGREPIQFAKEFIQYLNENNRSYLLATNCPWHSPAELVKKLLSMDIQVGEENILTSGQAAASYLARVYPGARAYVVGTPALKKELLSLGIQIVQDQPDCVVVGHDPDFTYEKMKKAARFIIGGAAFVVTNGDSTIPAEDGIVPHTGAIAASIETASGIKPLIIGKPEGEFLNEAFHRLNCTKESCCIIGDRLDTDILTGVRHGILSYLVMTGVTDEKELEQSPIRPSRVFGNLKDIIDFELSVDKV
jgi:HAD superfamily hydrolase (TIGR01457 family)